MDFMTILQDRLNAIAEGTIEMLPQLTVAVILLIITWIAARILTRVYTGVMTRSNMRPSLVDVFRKLINIGVWIVGILVSATVLFPGLTPGSLLAGLGVGSIAIGLAFKDTFENFLAGILILARDPMKLGDAIECEDVDGNVERITIRDTYVRRRDGELVLVPNGFLFNNPLKVLTDQEKRRVKIVCGVAYGEDVEEAREVIRGALDGRETIDYDKPVEVYADEFGSSSIDFVIRWWTGSKPVDVRKSKDEVIPAIKRALDDAGIEIPFPYRTLTFKEPLEVRGGANDNRDG